MARSFPLGGAIVPGRPIIVPVATGAGQSRPGMSVQVVTLPEVGRTVSVAVAMPKGSLIACLKLDEVACLQDELDRAVAELTGFVHTGGAA